MSKNYLGYLLKSNRQSLIFICILNLLILAISLFSIPNIGSIYFAQVLICVHAGVLCFSLPARLFHFVHNRKAVDTFFPLSVSREKMMHTILVYMIGAVLIPFILSTLCIMGFEIFRYHGMHMNYAAFIGMMSLSYSALILFHSMVYLFANSVFDGVVMIGAYTFVPLLIYVVCATFMDHVIYAYQYPYLNQLSYLSLTFTTLVEGLNMISKDFFAVDANYLKWLLSIVVYLLVSYFGLRREFIERKTERAEAISNEFFSYPLIINLYAIALIFVSAFNYQNSLESLRWVLLQNVFIFTLYTVANFVYKRKIMVSLKSVIVFVVSLAASLLLVSAAYRTEGFHLSESYNHTPETISIYAHQYVTYGGDAESNNEIRNLLVSKGYEADSVYVECKGDLKKTDAHYEEAIKTINGLRDKNVREHYHQKEQYYLGMMNLTEKKINGSAKRDYDYEINQASALTLSELKELNKFCEVKIYQIYDPVKMEFFDANLSDLLK